MRIEGGVTSAVKDGQSYLVASADGLADSLIQLVEDFLWVNETVEAVVFTYEDAAIEAVMDAVAGFDHRTVARESMVEG